MLLRPISEEFRAAFKPVFAAETFEFVIGGKAGFVDFGTGTGDDDIPGEGGGVNGALAGPNDLSTGFGTVTGAALTISVEGPGSVTNRLESIVMKLLNDGAGPGAAVAANFRMGRFTTAGVLEAITGARTNRTLLS